MAAGPWQPWLARWQLVPDGHGIERPGSSLLPVTLPDGRPAMLKQLRDPDELRGAQLLAWWQGQGAVAAYDQSPGVLLMERATGPSALALLQQGDDAQATQVVCATAALLHAQRQPALAAQLPTVQDRFVALNRPLAVAVSAAQAGVVQQCAAVAQALLNAPEHALVLHGDLHHGNVLQSARGWLAIDPKGVVGERGFELAVLLCNPDVEADGHDSALLARAQQMAAVAGVDRRRLVQWAAARSALSAAWFAEDGDASLMQRQLQRAHHWINALKTMN